MLLGKQGVTNVQLFSGKKVKPQAHLNANSAAKTKEVRVIIRAGRFPVKLFQTKTRCPWRCHNTPFCYVFFHALDSHITQVHFMVLGCIALLTCAPASTCTHTLSFFQPEPFHSEWPPSSHTHYAPCIYSPAPHLVTPSSYVLADVSSSHCLFFYTHKKAAAKASAFEAPCAAAACKGVPSRLSLASREAVLVCRHHLWYPPTRTMAAFYLSSTDAGTSLFVVKAGNTTYYF